MRNSLALMLLAGACCLVFSQEAKADVNTLTEVSYYEPTNSILAWAETIPDYDTLAYYELGHWGLVFKNDTQITMFNGGSYDGNDAYYEEFFPYDPDADYTIEVYPQLVAKIRHNIGDTYEDYYNYIQWTYGNSVYYPYYFGFTAPGPDVQINGPSILLGTVYSFFTMGATSGPPHHLKVKSDLSTTLGSCGPIERNITYELVDSNGRRAGKSSIKEVFPGTITSSCTGNNVTPSPCSLDYFIGNTSTFKDQLKTGCPFNGDANCGYTINPEKWVWCRPGMPDVTLATLVYNVRHSFVEVNGRSAPWPAGTEFYP
jgi:hypothetical protein